MTTPALASIAIAEIDALFAPFANEASPGFMVTVTLGDDVVYQRCAGMADLAHGIALSPTSVVRIASQSKQFTVLLALMLEAEGKLSLGDDVHDHCPWLPAYDQPITLRHLAANTSGLRDILDTMILAGIPILAPSSRATARAIVARQKGLNFPPDTDLLYSNSNFLLLSEILEQVSGLSFDDLLRERITGPLGMHDTRLMARDDEIYPRLATPHRRGPGGCWLKAAWGIAIGGEGGLVSTLQDMLAWQANLRRPKVGDTTMIARMEAPGALINGIASPYGLGLVASRHRGLRCVGHSGWIAGSRSESIRIPERDLGIVLLANHDDFSPYALTRRIADVVLDLEGGPALSPSAIALLTARAGTYREDGTSALLRIASEGGTPSLVSSMGASELEEVAQGRFRPRAGLAPYDLLIQADGSIETEKFGRRRRFRRVETVPSDRSVLPAGRYRDESSGLEARFHHHANGPGLRLSSPFGTLDLGLEPCDRDLFLAHPASRETHDAWRAAPWELPWLFSVRCLEDAIILNSDRSADIVLHRLANA
ncbi:beta-lactamase family protein [Labrys sp. KNU-23]|uniref:serine hydrolase domain-containing protein n=1 Tax=Labrys sp. KNU-23 TaxID=2789216 RepID=UPI0011EBB223|nr:serine hydrolase domain-containing protein [Labrys sp. KNU-23]QEN86380.1 beta-lactamase family protein [Labrys sp. KNU-23]